MIDAPVPRFVFAAFYPEGPHAGPVSIGLFAAEGGNLLTLFSLRQKAISFAIKTLGAPPGEDQRWDGIELSATDLLQLVLEDRSIKYVALDPSPSGDAELMPVQEFVENLSREIDDPEDFGADFRRNLVRLLVYGDVG